jgi:hypothetical protein
MSLNDELQAMRAEIRTDDYTMSIGEWISLYESDELDVHPEFQRFFRWTDYQKTRLIESILLGIPIPLIFVAQRPDGVWDVVDGVQRLSTIFQFAGILHDEQGNAQPPLVLERTEYLPSLEGLYWEHENSDKSLTAAERLQIKRSKLGVSIILKESDDRTKYDLFQRLNTGGSPLSDQEVRNCILVMANRDCYAWLRELANDDAFKECIALTDRAIEEQYDMELALRFIVFRTLHSDELTNIGDLNMFLTNRMLEFSNRDASAWRNDAEAFRTVFSTLSNITKSDSFRRFDPLRDRFIGGFLISAFEVIALGL